MTCCENQMYTNLMVVLDWFFLPMLLAQAHVLAVLSTIFLIVLVFLLQFYAIPVQLLYIFNNQFCLKLTIGKLVLLQKFCVTAIVLSKFKTTCHHPPGTNTVSPGFCKISIGLQSSGQLGSFVLGQIILNHVMASSRCFPP